jgi:hypothetical protein
MTHIDDWLDERHANKPADEGEQFALEWLEHFRRPAYKQDHKWLAQNALFCTYKGERYRCIGASRMGDRHRKNVAPEMYNEQEGLFV